MGTPPQEELTGLVQMGSIESIKSISPGTFGTLVKSVSENKELEPLSLPPTILAPLSQPTLPKPVEQVTQASESKSSEHTPNGDAKKSFPQDVASNMATGVADSQVFENSRLDSFGSAPTAVSSMSIVRGFSKENISQVRRSRTQLAPTPQPILKPSPSILPRQNPLVKPPKNKQAKFLVGASSEGDDSSFESPERQSSLTTGIRNMALEPQKLERKVLNPHPRLTFQNSDPNNSESAIEDDDEDEDEWEDENGADGEASEEVSFDRVSSHSQLTSRRSLLTNMLHEGDRAKALQNMASRSNPAIRRSRTSSHTGPLGASPQLNPQLSRAQPTMINQQQASESIPIARSPRTNRRNMLSTELTGSLRKHMLWERQQRNPASKALKNRQFKSEMHLAEHVQGPHLDHQLALRRNDTTIYDNGLQEYFEKGW